MNRLLRAFGFLCCMFFLYGDVAYAQYPAALDEVPFKAKKRGLNYTYATARISTRVSPSGAGLPYTLTVSGIPTGAVIEKSLMWWTASSNTTDSSFSLTSGSTTYTRDAHLLGAGPDKCWGYTYSTNFRADVSDIITANGSYTLDIGLGSDPVDGFGLIVIYSDSTAGYVGSMTINDGIIVVNGGTTSHNMSVAVPCSNTTRAEQIFVAGDFQVNPTISNGTRSKSVAWNWFNFDTLQTTLAAGTNTKNFTISSSSDCYSVIGAAIYYQYPVDSFSTMISKTRVGACGAANGKAKLTVSTGSPYSITWFTSPPQSGDSAVNLAAGTYTFRLTDTCGNQYTDTVNIPVAVPAAPAVTSPVFYCYAAVTSALTATAASATDTLLWYTVSSGGSGTKIAPVPVSTDTGSIIYYVSSKSSLGCEGSRAALTVTVHPQVPAPVVSSPVVYCAGAATAALTAIAADTLVWYTSLSGSGSLSAPTPSSAGAGTTTYYVSQRNVCESAKDSVKVIINPLPAQPLAVHDTGYCAGITAMALSATAGSATDTLKWYTTATGGTGTAAAPVPVTTTAGVTAYYVGATGANGCESATRDTVLVQTNAIPATPGVSSPVMYCAGATATALTAVTAAGDTLRWYTTAAGGTHTAAPVPATGTAGKTTYYVSQISAAGCEGARDSILVQVNALPSKPVVITPVSICIGAAATALSATASSASDTLKWYTTLSGGTASLTPPVPATTTAGLTVYYVSQTSVYGCAGPMDTIQVRIRPLALKPVVTSPVVYCMGASATALTATAGSSTDTLLWYTAIGGSSSKTAPTPSTAATGNTVYYVSGKTSFGCEGNKDSITVRINPLAATPSVATPVIYCQNATAVVLTATAGSSTDTLLWYTVSSGGTGTKTAPTPATSSAGTTNYYVSGKTSLGCEGSRANLKVTVNPAAATPTVTTPVNYCIGAAAVALTAKAGAATDTLLWYTVASAGTASRTAPVPLTTPVGSTTYYVSGKTSLGCEGSRAALTVSIRPLATTPAVTSPVYYCLNDVAVALTATAGATGDTLLWYTSVSGGSGSKAAPKPLTTPAGSTTYYVSGKTSFGCEGSRAPLTVTINPLPVVHVSSLSATGVVVCLGSSVLLQAAAPTATAYQWFYKTTLLPGADTDTVSAAARGFWTAQVTDINGCRSRDSLFIYPDTSTPPVLTPMAITICEGTATNLTCSPGLGTNTFRWHKDGLLMPAIPVSWHIMPASESGTYFVEVTNREGCTYLTDTASLDFYPAMPRPVITQTGSVLSVSGPYLNYQWYRNTMVIRGANAASFNMSSDGDYYVVVSGAYGCRDTSDVISVYGLGIHEPATDPASVRIYPNPTQGRLLIESPVPVQVAVTDINGHMVLQPVYTRDIDLTLFADGLYLVYVRDGDGRMVKIERINKSSVQH